MLDFIIKYWVELLFTGIVGLIGWFFKRYIDLLKKQWKQHEDEMKQEIKAEAKKLVEKEHSVSVDYDKELEENIKILSSSLSKVTKGLLSLQGKQFMQFCRELLEDEHIITVDEYEQCEADHKAYNGLGGNHRGDTLFSAVVTKFKAQITK